MVMMLETILSVGGEKGYAGKPEGCECVGKEFVIVRKPSWGLCIAIQSMNELADE